MALRRKLAFSAVFTLVLLLAIEATLRVVCRVRGDFPPVADRSLEYEWKWAKAHLAAGRPRFDESEHVFDEHLGWTLRPGFRKDGVTCNAAGMRGPREITARPDPGRRRLLVLGDSFAYGAFVRDEEVFTHLLETEYLPGWDVLNLAVSGYGTDQQLMRYEYDGRQYGGDVVALCFYVDDTRRNVLTFKVYQKPRYRLVDGELRLSGLPLATPEELYGDYAAGRRRIGVPWYLPHLLLRAQSGLARSRDLRVDASHEQWRLLSALMQKFAAEVRRDGALPVWVILPHRDVVSTGTSRWEAVEELCEQRAGELEMPCLRLSGPFLRFSSEHPGASLYRPSEAGGHFSTTGHRVVAEELARLIRERFPAADARGL